MTGKTRLAGIQYVGLQGISEACVQAVQRLLQYNDCITHAKVLTAHHDHCLLLTVDEIHLIAVKSGFRSGYRGEGPRALARALQMLRAHGVFVEEVEVDRAIIDRLDASGMTELDLETINAAKALRPSRIYDYIDDEGLSSDGLGQCWARFPAVLPYAAIDGRLTDLALRFPREPNDTLLQGFRRLEDAIRERIDSKENGAKLFVQAFQGENAPLTWCDLLPSEVVGRVSLFTGAYMAHRNPRAHREMDDDPRVLLSEFLVLNHLFRLESEATPSRP